MVHEHHASRLHWDLRLELDWALKSWAVPKGLPLEQGVKRLAVEQDDHDLAYAAFEGTIPAGQFGAGEVILWDRGTFEVKERSPDKLVVDVRGTKARGVYHLVRARLDGKEENWLVFLGQWPPKTAPRKGR
jgi:DNA ligase D-like protein (predicted 3'-phosphoesterase)